MKSEKGKNIVISILIVVIIILSTLFILFLTGNFNLEKGDNKKLSTYTYSGIKGLYNYSGNYKDESGNEGDMTIDLYLYENGIFVYKIESPKTVNYGNYIINNDEITLNSIFSTNTGVGINIEPDPYFNKKIKISSDNKLIDNENFTSENIILEKKSLEEEQKFLTEYDFSSTLKKEIEHLNTIIQKCK